MLLVILAVMGSRHVLLRKMVSVRKERVRPLKACIPENELFFHQVEGIEPIIDNTITAPFEFSIATDTIVIIALYGRGTRRTDS